MSSNDEAIEKIRQIEWRRKVLVQAAREMALASAAIFKAMDHDRLQENVATVRHISAAREHAIEGAKLATTAIDPPHPHEDVSKLKGRDLR